MRFIRYLAPFVFPFWMIGYPGYCYWSEFGRVIPTSKDIHTSYAAWSDGLTLISLTFAVSFVLALLVHALLFLFFLRKGSRREMRFCFLGSLLGLATTGLALYLFGNLMDI